MPKRIIKRAVEEIGETVKKTTREVAAEPARMAKTVASQLGFSQEDLEKNPYAKMDPAQLEQVATKKKQQGLKQAQQLSQQMKALSQRRTEEPQPAEEVPTEAKKEEIPEPPVTPTKRRRQWFPQLPFSARQKMGTGEVRRGVHG